MDKKIGNFRLLILACAAKKLDGAHPAEDIYQSPAWHVFRKWKRETSAENVAQTVILVLSARYGLVSGAETIQTYDERITDENKAVKQKVFAAPARELVKSVCAERKANRVFLHLPENYRFIIKDALTVLSADDVLIETATGAPGIKLKQLKSWLNATN